MNMKYSPLKTFVIAEDDLAIQQILLRALTAAGYENVGVTASGLQAISLVKEKKPQLIWCDLHLADLAGMEVARHLNLLGTAAIVLMTGDADPTLPRQAMALGA